MSALHIRDVPETVMAALKRRAERHHRSVQQELRLLLQEIADREPPAEELPPMELVTVHAGGKSSWRREEIYGDDGR